MASTGTRIAARSDQGLPGPLCEDELWRTSGSALRQGHPRRRISGDCLFTKPIKKLCICQSYFSDYKAQLIIRCNNDSDVFMNNYCSDLCTTIFDLKQLINFMFSLKTACHYHHLTTVYCMTSFISVFPFISHAVPFFSGNMMTQKNM